MGKELFTAMEEGKGFGRNAPGLRLCGLRLCLRPAVRAAAGKGIFLNRRPREKIEKWKNPIQVFDRMQKANMISSP